tara:strand:+ start:1126 stop:1566 length:441 start_codon:yes stop_codon:yes gene_type:complete
MKNVTSKELIDLRGVERFREYIMPEGKRVRVESPVSLKINDDGSHELEDGSGFLHHIADTWFAFWAEGTFEFNVTKDGEEGGDWVDAALETGLRRYFFEEGNELCISNIESVFEKESGSHKIICEEGKIFYVRPVWSVLSKLPKLM